MQHILLILITPLLLTRFAPAASNMGKNESEAQTYLKLYTIVTGTGEDKQENWLLANNGPRRIMATIEIIGAPDDGKELREKKNVIVESKASLPLGLRSSNGSAPNTIVIIKAAFTPTP